MNTAPVPAFRNPIFAINSECEESSASFSFDDKDWASSLPCASCTWSEIGMLRVDGLAKALLLPVNCAFSARFSLCLVVALKVAFKWGVSDIQ